jgi:hypothetical protein
MRDGVLRHFARCAMLGLLWCAALTAQDFDTSNPRALASERFERALRASRDAREALPGFLARWSAAASEQEIALLGSGNRNWNYGDGPLYRAFLADSSFESHLDQVLPTLDAMLQRVPALAAEAPWQSLWARAQLKAGEPQLALVSARRAWALDARLCASDCAPLVRIWLQTGSVPAPSEWPAVAIDPLYHPGRTECSKDKPPSFPWLIPEVELVAATRGSQAELAWLLRRGWQVHLAGCTNFPYGLRQRLDDLYPRVVVEQAWAELQRSLRARPGSAVDFLGVRLPLPAVECDFVADASCRTGHRRLQPTSALALAEGLRAFSRHLAAPLQCEATGEGGGTDEFAALQRRMRGRLEQIDEMDPGAARAALRRLLAQPDWRPLWRSDVPYELVESLAHQARTDAPDEVLQMVQSFIDRAPEPLARSDSSAELLALVLLRAGQAQAGLQQLVLAQQRYPQLERAQRIMQLRAGLAGADLDASLPVVTLPRPWIHGQRESEAAVDDAWPAPSTQNLDGVLVGDVVYALGGDLAVARRALKAQWVPTLLERPDDGEELASALRRAYADPEARAGLLAQAQSGFRLAPEPHLDLDGVRLLLPDRYCVDPRCRNTAPVDAAWVVRKLQALIP